MSGEFTPGTKMVRRSDVIAIVQKEISTQWTICEGKTVDGDRIAALHTRSRIDALRIVRDCLHRVKVFVSKDHAPALALPSGEEFAERVRIAGNMVGAPNDADPAMLRLLSDLHVPLTDLQSMDDAQAAAA